MDEITVVKVIENPEVDIPGHTFCTGREIAGELMGIDHYALKIGYFGKGGTSVEHTHIGEHVFYIVEGAITIYTDGKEYTAHTGEALHIPSNIPHSSANAYDGTTTYIALTLPPS